MQKRDLCRSISNINVHESLTGHFALVLTVCKIVIFLTLDHLDKGHGREENGADAVRLRILTCIRAIRVISALALTFCKILIF